MLLLLGPPPHSDPGALARACVIGRRRRRGKKKENEGARAEMGDAFGGTTLGSECCLRALNSVSYTFVPTAFALQQV